MSRSVGKWTVEYRARVAVSEATVARPVMTTLRQEVRAASAADATRVCALLHGGMGHRVIGRVA